MAKAKKVTLLTIRVPDKVGQLAAVAELVATAKVNIIALAASESGGNADIYIVADRTKKAKSALAGLGADVKEEEALRVDLQNKPGSLLKVSRKIAQAGVNVRRSWATAFSGKTAAYLLVTSDNEKAAAALAAKKEKKPVTP
jgi:hypothetical protein